MSGCEAVNNLLDTYATKNKISVVESDKMSIIQPLDKWRTNHAQEMVNKAPRWTEIMTIMYSRAFH